MKTTTVTIAEGKRDFSRLIKEAAEKNEDIVVTKRGKPMAVIVSYDEYRHSRKVVRGAPEDTGIKGGLYYDRGLGR